MPIMGCTHIHVLDDGAEMLGFPCLNGKDPKRMRRIYEDGDALHILRDEMGKGYAYRAASPFEQRELKGTGYRMLGPDVDYYTIEALKVLRDFLLHRSSINNSARLSNKFRGFYFSFKFGISGLLHQVITTIADRIRDKDTSQSKQNLQSSLMTFIHKTLIIPSVLDSCFNSSTVCEVKTGLGEVNPTHAYYNGSCTSKDIEDPSWSISFKTRSTQKTSLALEALWKTLFVLYLYLIGTLDWGEVNLTHAYCNGSYTSKDTEDPSWSTSFKTRSTQKTSLALEALWKTLFVLYLYLIGTLLHVAISGLRPGSKCD
ncbi:hypothetical protein Tco_0708848 [Tanacetum coccineum]